MGKSVLCLFLSLCGILLTNHYTGFVQTNHAKLFDISIPWLLQYHIKYKNVLLELLDIILRQLVHTCALEVIWGGRSKQNQSFYQFCLSYNIVKSSVASLSGVDCLALHCEVWGLHWTAAFLLPGASTHVNTPNISTNNSGSINKYFTNYLFIIKRTSIFQSKFVVFGVRLLKYLKREVFNIKNLRGLMDKDNG